MLFSHYVKTNRKSMSQDEFARALISFDNEFEGLNTVTVCRWETNFSLPSLKNICKVIAYFGDSPSKILPLIDYNKTSRKGHSLVTSITNKVIPSTKGIQIGNYPTSARYEIVDLNKDFDTNLVNSLLDFDHSIFDTEFPVTKEILLHWSSSSSTINLVCRIFHTYLGHLIALRLKPDTFEEIIDGNMEESEICSSHLVSENEDHCLYVYSIYGANKVIATFFILEMVKAIFRSNGFCRKLGGLCATVDGVRLARNLNMTPKTIGPNDKNSSIRIKGQNVEWVTFSGEVSSLFLSLGERVISEVQLNM